MGSTRRAFISAAAALTAAASGALAGCKKGAQQRSEPDEPADVAIIGGRVLTLDRKKPEAEAISLRGGVVQAIGTRAEIEAFVGSKTEVIDLAGGLAVPGLTDAHAHLVNLGRSLEQVDLRGATSMAEVIDRLKKGAPPSGWVRGRGWDQNLWPETDLYRGMPVHTALSQAFPDRPVWLHRVDGHAALANAAAMKAAVITDATDDPAGGEILRVVDPAIDANTDADPDADSAPVGAPAPGPVGSATGVFVDTAMDLVPVPTSTAAEIQRYIEKGQAHILARGITGVHAMGVGAVADGVYRDMAANGGLQVRVTAYADRDWFEKKLIDTTPLEVAPADLYALVGAKIYADGALGSRGAALLEAYSDRKGHRGKLQVEPQAFAELATRAMKRKWQLATHAIGDRGNRVTLDAYSAAFQRYRDRDHRFRIEHAQVLSLEDIPRFAEMSVIASMQPTHATSDMAWVPDRVGPQRSEGAYAWQRLRNAGVHLCLGSDFPVEEADITHGIHAAVTRQDADGKPEGGWMPQQRLTLQQAIAGFSKEAAFAARRDDHLGTLAVGKQGDVTCFAQDLFDLAPADLRDAKIAATVVAGVVRHRS